MKKFALVFWATVFIAQAGCSDKKNPVSADNDMNGLKSWVAQTSGTMNALHAVHFLNAAEGWAAGDNSTLLRTTNSGANWSAVSAGLPDSRDIKSVRFIDANSGWIAGPYFVGRTLNGGANWGGLLYQQSPEEFRTKVFPLSSSQAWAVGKTTLGTFNARAFWRYTYNSTGTRSTFSIGQSSSDIVNDVYFVDADNGWSVGTFGRIIRVTSASADQPVLTIQTSGTNEDLNCIHMLDPNTGWVAGAKGTILTTTNGGATWTAQTSAVTVDLRAVSFADAKHGLAVGEAGTILYTTDGGASWATQNSNVTHSLRRVHFVDANTAYVVGDNGTILKATTSGAALAKEAPRANRRSAPAKDYSIPSAVASEWLPAPSSEKSNR